MGSGLIFSRKTKNMKGLFRLNRHGKIQSFVFPFMLRKRSGKLPVSLQYLLSTKSGDKINRKIHNNPHHIVPRPSKFPCFHQSVFFLMDQWDFCGYNTARIVFTPGVLEMKLRELEEYPRGTNGTNVFFSVFIRIAW